MPINRKKALKEIKKLEHAIDPSKAVHSELMEQGDYLEGINESVGGVKKAIEDMKEPLAKSSSASDFLESFLKSIKGDKGDQGDKPQKGVDYLTEEDIQELKNDVLESATPIKGKDYFTEEEILQVVSYILERATPEKGVDYFDGKDGKDGKDGESIKGEPGRDGKDGKDGRDATVQATAKAAIEMIKDGKMLNISHLKDGVTVMGAVAKFSSKDQRWHGGGISQITAGTGISITQTSAGIFQISTNPAVPSFSDNEVPSGTVDGANQTFTLAHTPTSGSVKLYWNGVRQAPTGDFTVTGATITTIFTAQSGDVLLTDYRY